MIELKAMSKCYGTTVALDNISLYIPAKQIFGIIGRSGAGKSSLLRMINLLERPTKGEIFFDGTALTTLNSLSLRKIRRQIGMIFQHFNLLQQKTVFDNIALPLRLLRVPESIIRTRLQILLDIIQMTSKQYCYPAQLSGGQKQRVAIARAIATQPRVLLCDEATSALDPETTKTILNLLQQINQELGITIILITHEMDVVKTICDRVALIEQGRIVRDESVIDFFLKPHEGKQLDFLNAYLAHDIPAPIQARLSGTWSPRTNPLLRIVFQGEVASQPIIAYIMKKLEIDISILQGNIEFIKHQPVGHLIITMTKQGTSMNPAEVDSVKLALREQGLHVEELGYVA